MSKIKGVWWRDSATATWDLISWLGFHGIDFGDVEDLVGSDEYDFALEQLWGEVEGLA